MSLNALIQIEDIVENTEPNTTTCTLKPTESCPIAEKIAQDAAEKAVNLNH